ncbi:MAG: N-acetylmuramic acid 6-phosphate etherase [Nitrospirota bacterium]
MTRPLEELSPDAIIALMDRADARAVEAVKAARGDIEKASLAAAAAIGSGGRLIYIGAGTSGRLGVLDASECPPTFSANPGQVTGVIAGGKKALTAAVEGAEDDARAGKTAISRLKTGKNDMVLGISASGTTPYVLGALEEAKRRGADTWLLRTGARELLPKAGKKAAGPHAQASNPMFKEIILDSGPEVIQGSTRLAAGTATKLALNRISTAAFVMRGKVYGDLMVDVMPTNEKLIKRACGIIIGLTGCTEKDALALLKKSGGSPKAAVLMKAKGLSRTQAERLLREKGGFLRKALK